MMLTGYPVEDLVFRGPSWPRPGRAATGSPPTWPPTGSATCRCVVGYLDADGPAPVSADAEPGRGRRATPPPLLHGGGWSATLLQAPPAQLRRLRRGPLLRARRHPDRGAGRRRRRRADHLRGPLAGRRPVRGRPAGRRRPGGQHQRLAVRAEQGRRPAAAGAPPGRRGRAPPSPTSTWSAARTSWSSTATRWSSTADGELLARAAAVRRAPAGRSTSTCRPASRRTPPTPRRWPDGDARSTRARRRRSSRRRPPAPARRPAAGSRAGRRRGRGLAGAGAGPARLRRQERLPVGGARPLRRHRLGGGGRDRRRRARAATGWSASRCPASYSSEHSRDDAADLAKRTGLDYRVEPIQPMVDAFLAQPVAVRAGRGEPAGPGARRDPDGAVQPGGPPGADHRQQERAGGRLLHPVRRLGRRLQPAQGRAEDAGLAAGEVAQRRRGPARARRRRSRRTRSASRPAPSCAPASSTATRCPTTTCSTRS